MGQELKLWDAGTGTAPWGRRNHLRRDGSDESLCGVELAGGPDWLDLCARCEAIALGLGFTVHEPSPTSPWCNHQDPAGVVW